MKILNHGKQVTWFGSFTVKVYPLIIFVLRFLQLSVTFIFEALYGVETKIYEIA